MPATVQNPGIYTNTDWSVELRFTTSAGAALPMPGTYQCLLKEKAQDETPEFVFDSADGTIDLTDAVSDGIIRLTATVAQHSGVNPSNYVWQLVRTDLGTDFIAAGIAVVARPGDLVSLWEVSYAVGGASAAAYIIGVPGPAGNPAANFIMRGGGAVLPIGYQGHFVFPYACELTSVWLLAENVGSMEVDFYLTTYAAFATPVPTGSSICGGTPLTLVSDDKVQDNSLAGWTVLFPAGAIIGVNLVSVTDVLGATVIPFVQRL